MTIKTLASVANQRPYSATGSDYARVDFIHLTSQGAYRLRVRDVNDKFVMYATNTDDILAFGMAIVAALEPTPATDEYPVGTRVLLKASSTALVTAHAYVGKFGTVIADPDNLNADEAYAHFVQPDGVEYGVWFYADEVELAAPAARLSDYTADDRVRVTSDVFPDDDAPVGSLGTVVNVSSFVNVVIDGYDPEYSLPFKPSEIEPYDLPAPRVYKYPEGLYKSPYTEARVFIKHEDGPQGYEITYLDVANAGVPVVNRNMNENVVSYYTLVASA